VKARAAIPVSLSEWNADARAARHGMTTPHGLNGAALRRATAYGGGRVSFLRHTTAQGVQCGGEREATNSRGEALRRATAWSRSGVVTSTRDRGWTVFEIPSTPGSIFSRWIEHVRSRSGGQRTRSSLSGRCGRAGAGCHQRQVRHTSARGLVAEDAGNVVAVSFEDRDSPRALRWRRRSVPRRRRRHGPARISAANEC
jgi:hypothetical protein